MYWFASEVNILFNFSVGWKAGVGQALDVSSQAENYTDRHQLHQSAKSTYLPPLQISKCRCSSCQLLSDYAYVSVCQMGMGGLAAGIFPWLSALDVPMRP